MLVSYIYNTRIQRMEKIYSCENPIETAMVERAWKTFTMPTRIENRY